MQNLLCLAVTGTERGVELEVIDIIEKSGANCKQHILGGGKVEEVAEKMRSAYKALIEISFQLAGESRTHSRTHTAWPLNLP